MGIDNPNNPTGLSHLRSGCYPRLPRARVAYPTTRCHRYRLSNLPRALFLRSTAYLIQVSRRVLWCVPI